MAYLLLLIPAPLLDSEQVSECTLLGMVISSNVKTHVELSQSAINVFTYEIIEARPVG